MCTRAKVSLLIASICCVACGGEERQIGRWTGAVINGASAAGGFASVGVLMVEVDGNAPAVHCSGTLIAPDVVLTAAHCSAPLIGMPNVRVTFWIGDALSCGEPALIVEATEPIAHPKFRYANYPYLHDENDIGLVKLSRAITEVPSLPVLQPTEREHLNPAARVQLIGFGMAVTGGGGLQKSVGTAAKLVEVAETEFMSHESDTHACYGDSGGPALIDIGINGAQDLRVAGVLSRAVDEPKCVAPEVIYTRVDAYGDFLGQHVSSLCSGDGEDRCASTEEAQRLPADLHVPELEWCQQDPGSGPERSFGGCAVSAGANDPLTPSVALIAAAWLALLWLARGRQRTSTSK